VTFFEDFDLVFMKFPHWLFRADFKSSRDFVLDDSDLKTGTPEALWL